MTVSNGKITAPISMKDPYTCLGVGASANGYDLGYICSDLHKKINPYSKKKPVKYAHMAPADNVEWWRATDERCGFSFPSTEIVIANQDEDGVWVYEPPVGGDSSPYRLLDFEGYNHAASHEWIALNIPSTIVFGDYSELIIGGAIQLESDDRLSYYETISRMLLSFRANSNPFGSYLEKELPINDVKDKGGRFSITLTGEELRTTGIVAGGEFRVHLYGFDKTNHMVSVRNHADMKTFWRIKANSAEPYVTEIRNQVVLKNAKNTSELWIYSLYLDLNALSYSGGKLAAGSRIRLYKYVSDDYDYPNYAPPIWEQTNLPEMTVTAGNRETYTLGTPQAITVYTDTTGLTEAIFIWDDKNQNELARLKRHVAASNVKPGV